jgi:hypothetical protein
MTRLTPLEKANSSEAARVLGEDALIGTAGMRTTERPIRAYFNNNIMALMSVRYKFGQPEMAPPPPPLPPVVTPTRSVQ